MEQTEWLNGTMEDFLQQLSSGAPVPGGGGASAYVAAAGISLGAMVGNLTSGKKKYAQYQEEIEQTIEKAEEIRTELAAYMQKDAESFAPLARAYGLPRTTPQEQADREQILEKALTVASETPLALMEKVLDAMKLLERLSVIGSRLAISDVGAGIQMAQAALNGASLNVFINTKLMKDRDVAEEMNFRADRMLAEGNELATRVFDEVMELIR